MKKLKINNPYPIKDLKITDAILPNQVVLPTFGAKTIVKIGDRVKTGQVIAEGKVYLHASISGFVQSIDQQLFPHPSGLKTECITIKGDGKDINIEYQTIDDYKQITPEKLLEKLETSGIVGLGGAGFAASSKIGRLNNASTIVVNATECEPGVEADNALMLEYPEQILQGVEILQYITGVKQAIISVEDDKKRAYKILKKNNKNRAIKIKKVETNYTSGAEKILIKNLLGIDIKQGKFATDYGVLCQNVATIKAIYDYLIKGVPLIKRIVTITGDNEKPHNLMVRNGTIISNLINKAEKIRLNGLMMGIDIDNDNYPVLKTTNAIFNNKKVKARRIQECIRCGKCIEICPVDLLPDQLYFFIKGDNLAKTLEYNIDNCLLCRCCDEICPSNIPLSQYFHYALQQNKQIKEEEKMAELSKKRFEFREYRLARNKKERDIMMAQKREEAKKKLAAKQLESQQKQEE